MKSISDQLQARLEGPALTLCLCWRLIRKDNVILGLTQHDQAITVEDVVYLPGASLDAGEFTQNAGLKPGRASAAGALSADAISESDLAAGVWDRCRVDIYQVDWAAPELGGIPIWSGFLTEVTQSETGRFEAELVSLKADLEKPVGRILQRRCDASLGDSRCKASPDGRTCDQRFETCRYVFGNADNYRGFPHMPGMNFVLAGPSAGRNDGGKR